MEYYPVTLEIFLYLAAFYLFYRKRELTVIYLPMLFFTRNLIDEYFLRHMLWYLLVMFILGFAAYKANSLKRVNLAAILLFFYFTVLYIFSHSLSATRPTYFAITCLIIAFIIVPNLYSRYSVGAVSNELYRMALCVLLLFIGNTMLSTITGYSPYMIYGRDDGVLYGNMGPTAFMLLPVALFIFLRHNARDTSPIQIIIGIMALALMLLSFRRTVQLSAAFAVVAFLVILFLQGDKRRALVTSALMVVFATLALIFTDFREQFSERYESRFGEQDLVHAEEGRFLDHTMVYEDMFVHGRYSVLFGHSFFNSAGNYGGGVRAGRTLHPDIPVILHSSGILGLIIYIAMVLKGFRLSWRCSNDNSKRVVWLFCLLVFLTYTLSGRITEASYSLGLVMLLFIPLAGRRRIRRRGRTQGDSTRGECESISRNDSARIAEVKEPVAE